MPNCLHITLHHHFPWSASLQPQRSGIYDVVYFYVIKGSRSSGCLLGSTSAVNLGILHIVNQVKSKAGTTSKATEASAGAVPAKSKQSKPATSLKGMLGELVASYDDILQGIGKLKGVKVTLHIDKTVKPVAQKHRRVPFHLRDKVEALKRQ
jgi:hypothetical protein